MIEKHTIQTPHGPWTVDGSKAGEGTVTMRVPAVYLLDYLEDFGSGKPGDYSQLRLSMAPGGPPCGDWSAPVHVFPGYMKTNPHGQLLVRLLGRWRLDYWSPTEYRQRAGGSTSGKFHAKDFHSFRRVKFTGQWPHA